MQNKVSKEDELDKMQILWSSIYYEHKTMLADWLVFRQARIRLGEYYTEDMKGLLADVKLWRKALDGLDVIGTEHEGDKIVHHGTSYEPSNEWPSCGICKVAINDKDVFFNPNPTGHMCLSISYRKYVDLISKGNDERMLNFLKSKTPRSRSLKILDLCLAGCCRDDDRRMAIGDHSRDITYVRPHALETKLLKGGRLLHLDAKLNVPLEPNFRWKLEPAGRLFSARIQCSFK